MGYFTTNKTEYILICVSAWGRSKLLKQNIILRLAVIFLHVFVVNIYYTAPYI